MKRRGVWCPAIGLIVLTGAAAGAQGQRAGLPAALSLIVPGEWQLRDMGTPGASRQICVADPSMLLQLGHGAARCDRVVIAEEPRAVTIRYTCPGAGAGRTTLTVETARVIRIETQGIASGAPFDHDFEGRRVGDCTPAPR